jgi:alkylation response protein AidB-like acyl-CoA dehydrogenase
MNFELTKTQEMTRRAMREFVRKEVVPQARELDENAEFPLTNYQQALELEVLDITLPEALGGIGDDFLNFIIALEEFGGGNAALAYSISVTEAVIHLLSRYGSKNHQEKYIQVLRTGEAFGAPALGVPDADSILAWPVQVVSDGGDYRLNGTLVYVPHASMADMAVVFAGSGDERLSAFILEKQMPGFELHESEKLMGVRGFPVSRVEIKDVRVTRDHLLGQEGKGRAIYDALVTRFLAAVGAIAVGISQAALEAAVSHSKSRVQFGKPLAQMEATQSKIADMTAGIEAARLLVYQAAFFQEQSKASYRQAAMAKLIASDLAVEVCREAVQIHGGYGYVKDYPVERLYRDALFSQIYNTTNETQRYNIARYAYRKIK